MAPSKKNNQLKSHKKEQHSKPQSSSLLSRKETVAYEKSTKAAFNLFDYTESILWNDYKSEVETIFPSDCGCVNGCEYDCINLQSYVQCDAQNCSDLLNCNNLMQINKYDRNDFYIGDFREKGYGLVTKIEIKPNEFLFELAGECISVEEKNKRHTKEILENEKPNFHFFEVQNGLNKLFIDSKFKGNISRFLNHSCNPNLTMEQWVVDGVLKILFCSLHHIRLFIYA